MGRGRQSFEAHSRNVDVKGNYGEVSEGNEEWFIGNWRKDDSYYKMSNNMPEFCASVLWNNLRMMKLNHK